MRRTQLGSWPDRSGLGRPLADEIERSRLIDLLAERWNVPVMLVEAPGGYGKSTAVAQAIRDNDDDPSGIDVYLRLLPIHRDAHGLAVALLHAFGGGDLTPEQGDDPATAVAGMMAACSPNAVCVHVDDVHRIDAIDGGVEFLDDLLGGLPLNGHLLLIGREIPAVRLARHRAADGIIEVGVDDLAFDDTELAVLTEHHHGDMSRVTGTRGWPAISRLALAAGESAPIEFLVEEVIESLSDRDRLALAAAVVSGGADPQLLKDLGANDAVADLARRVPLVVVYDDGQLGAHDLWQEAIEQLVDDRTRRTVAEAVVRRCAGRGDHIEAIEIALGSGLWAEARSQIMELASAGDSVIDTTLAERWLAVFPPSEQVAPELRFLGGLLARLSGDFAGGLDDVIAAADAFAASGAVDHEVTTCLELAVRSWLLGDRALTEQLRERSARLIRLGSERMRRSSAGGRALNADLRGDFRTALELYQQVENPDELVLRHQSTLALLVGDADLAISLLDRLERDFPSRLVSAHAAFVHWQSGDPGPVLAMSTRVSAVIANHRNRFLTMVFEALIGACRGRVPNAAAVEALAWERSREQTFVALVHAAEQLFRDSEAEVVAEFERRLEAIGYDDPLLRGETRRYLQYCYILSPVLRRQIDDAESSGELGALHLRLLSLSRTMLDARADQRAPIGATPEPEQVLTWLPLPWSAELAAHLGGRGDQRGFEIADYLSDVCGVAFHDMTRRLLERGGVVAAGAEAILANVPAPPRQMTSISVFGALEVRIGESCDHPGRVRVRQLLELLVLRRELTRRAVIDLLWPELDLSRARTNLRVTLSHLRKLLEPERQPAEAYFHVRQRGERIWLQRSEYLDTDAWKVERLLGERSSAERRGDDSTAISAARDALALWRSDPFPDIGDLPDVAIEAGRLADDLTAAAGWAAERLLARGDVQAAIDLAERLLEIDPYLQRAHDVIIGSQLSLGDLARAGRAIAVCRRCLAELEATPSASTEMLFRRYERRRASTISDVS